MKSSLLAISLTIVSGLLLIPALLYAETGQGTAGTAPISQPLVREGTLAVRLADALRLGSTTSEAEAESLLAGAGIAPRNGWIADYPVTPDIAGELQSAVGEASDAGRLTLGSDEAMRAFQDVMTGYDLAFRPSEAGQSGEGTSGYAGDPTVINNYYYDEGPPVVTYYAPPPDYYYLYSWVPYPFWWWNFWFPGFFVLLDFDVHHGHDHFHHGHDGHHEFVTNHFRDPATGRMGRIDPANRVQGATFSQKNGTGWSSASAERGAQGIFNSRNAARTAGSGMVTPAFSGSGSAPTATSSGGSLPRMNSGATRPSTGTDRTFSAPAPRRAFAAPEGNRVDRSAVSSGSTFTGSSGSGRTFSSGPSVNRSFSAPSSGGRAFTSVSGRSPAMAGRGSFGGFSRH